MKKILAILLFAVLSSSGADNDWQWYPVDCTYQKDMNQVFENCSPYDQELQEQARKKCGEEKWKEGNKLAPCGAPEATIIKTTICQKHMKLIYNIKEVIKLLMLDI